MTAGHEVGKPGEFVLRAVGQMVGWRRMGKKLGQRICWRIRQMVERRMRNREDLKGLVQISILNNPPFSSSEKNPLIGVAVYSRGLQDSWP